MIVVLAVRMIVRRAGRMTVHLASRMFSELGESLAADIVLVTTNLLVDERVVSQFYYVVLLMAMYWVHWIVG